jgi:hypothetical protein
MVHVIVKRLTWRSAGKAANFFVSNSATVRACRKSGQQVCKVSLMNRRSFLIATATTIALSPLLAQPVLAEEQRFRQIITRQIEALRAGDGEAAFDFASPYLQMRFRTGENFLAMVKRGYSAVIDPRRFNFKQVTRGSEGEPVQTVEIVDRQGRVWMARYSFEQQSDGSWRIAAVQLEKAPGADV